MVKPETYKYMYTHVFIVLWLNLKTEMKPDLYQSSICMSFKTFSQMKRKWCTYVAECLNKTLLCTNTKCLLWKIINWHEIQFSRISHQNDRLKWMYKKRKLSSTSFKRKTYLAVNKTSIFEDNYPFHNFSANFHFLTARLLYLGLAICL